MGELLSRFQVEIEQAQMNQIERLQLACGFRTKRELMNNALSLFLWVVRELISGGTILSMNEQTGSRKELSMPFFDHVRSSDYAEHFRRAETTTSGPEDTTPPAGTGSGAAPGVLGSKSSSLFLACFH